MQGLRDSAAVRHAWNCLDRFLLNTKFHFEEDSIEKVRVR